VLTAVEVGVASAATIMSTCILYVSPSIHIQQISQKAEHTANCILRCFTSGDIKMLVCAFVVYVRPMLEYNSVIWSPHLKSDIMQLERVQRQFIKRLKGFQHLSYSE